MQRRDLRTPNGVGLFDVIPTGNGTHWVRHEDEGDDCPICRRQHDGECRYEADGWVGECAQELR